MYAIESRFVRKVWINLWYQSEVAVIQRSKAKLKSFALEVFACQRKLLWKDSCLLYAFKTRGNLVCSLRSQRIINFDLGWCFFMYCTFNFAKLPRKLICKFSILVIKLLVTPINENDVKRCKKKLSKLSLQLNTKS